MYAGTKSGVVNFMRSIAKAYYFNDRVRVNTINPGTVKTNLLDSEAWKQFPDSYFTPVEKIVEVVLMVWSHLYPDNTYADLVIAHRRW
jgi:NAD(P)-dependent dehydrogenase (short-subunit alcohol dehydrogenase family)